MPSLSIPPSLPPHFCAESVWVTLGLVGVSSSELNDNVTTQEALAAVLDVVADVEGTTFLVSKSLVQVSHEPAKLTNARAERPLTVRMVSSTFTVI